jgi:hypothetical protein
MFLFSFSFLFGLFKANISLQYFMVESFKQTTNKHLSYEKGQKRIVNKGVFNMA